MIATGAQVPGIKEIPDRLNEVAPTAAVVAKSAGAGRKPWERETQTCVDSGQNGRLDTPQPQAESLASLLGRAD